jgi:hypothetical protein
MNHLAKLDHHQVHGIDISVVEHLMNYWYLFYLKTSSASLRMILSGRAELKPLKMSG